MKAAIKKEQDTILRICFNSFCDVKYYCRCMVTYVDKILAENRKDDGHCDETVARCAVYEELIINNLFNLFNKTASHLINIYPIVKILGSKVYALTCLHKLLACDTTGRFLKKGKQRWLDMYLSFDNSIDLAFMSLETRNPLGSISKLEELEKIARQNTFKSRSKVLYVFSGHVAL